MSKNHILNLDKLELTEEQEKQLRENTGKILKSFSQQMQQVSKTVLESLTPLLNSLQEATKAFTDVWQKEWLPQLSQIFAGLEKWATTIQSNAKVAAPLLKKANFWFTPSMPLGLLQTIKELTENGSASSEDIEKVIVGYYEDEKWAALVETVESRDDNEFYAKRMFIIKDALDAHIFGKYTLSIPTLIPQIEGLLSSIIGQPAGHPTRIFKSAIEKEYTDFLSAVSKDILLDLATSPILYGSIPENHFTPEKLSKWLDEKGFKEEELFNRAAISHGIQINYASKANSLRVFLLLDIIYWMTRKDELET